jgi:hypothetical protein
VPLTRRVVAGALLVPYAVVAAVTLRPDQLSGGFNTIVLGGSPSSIGQVTLGDRGWGPGGPQRRWYEGPGYYVQRGAFGGGIVRRPVRLKHGVHVPVGVISGIGLNGYAMGNDFDVLDALGLAEPIASHMESDPSLLLALPGHEKRLPASWISALLTAPGSTLGPGDLPVVSPMRSSRARFEVDVAWARASLRCAPIRRLVDASRAPMTLGRFVTNLGDAVGNTSLRIPIDPRRAYRKFCGAGIPAEVRAVRR